jgi:hypothetical protein
MGDQAPGALLLVMLDVDPSADESEFNRWYFEEHAAERLACPGFLSAKRFTIAPGAPSVTGLPPGGAVMGRPRYLALYELVGPAALETPEYLSLDAKASDRTRRMVGAMRDVIRNVYVPLARATESSLEKQQGSTSED